MSRIIARTPAHAAALVDFLTAEGEYASWHVQDRIGRRPALVVTTTADASLVASARSALGDPRPTMHGIVYSY